MALLDSMLAENFHAAYRQKRSGVLTAEGATTTMRFCFQDGSPVAIDLGDAKDRLLALTLGDYNRLTADQMQEVIGAWEGGQAAVADLVVARGYATEEEVGRSTQAMVEDCLCRFFSGKMTQVEFDDQKTIDGFDFDRQAFRLKIDAEVLLRTIDARVAEIRTIHQEFGSFDAVFVFNEDSPGSAVLNDYEKRILDFVDGKSSVQQIAASFRDSDLNTARTLLQLAQKKVIQRTGSGIVQSGPTAGERQESSGPTAGKAQGELSASRMAVRTAIAEAAMRQATPTMRDFTPYRQVVEEPRSRFMTVVLSLVLVLICAVAVLVYQYDQRRREFNEAKQHLAELINRADWAGARDQLDEARRKAGQDLSAVQQVDEMERDLRQAIDLELLAIEKLSAEGDHRQAGTRLSKLPADDKVQAMRLQISRAEAASQRRAQELADRASEALERNDGAGAVNLIASSPLMVREKTAATEVLDRWRVSKLEFANSSGAHYGKRLDALAKLKASEPPERVSEQIVLVEADLKRQEARLRDQLAAIKALIDKGAIEQATSDIERNDLTTQVEGSPLASELLSLQARISEINQKIADIIKSTTEAIIAVDQPQRLTAVGENLHQLFTSDLPGVGDKAKAYAAVLDQVAKISTAQPPEAQVVELNPIFEANKLELALSDALHKRVEHLRSLDEQAETALQNARALASEGKIEEAVVLLKNMLARPELQATQAWMTGQNEIDELGARLARRGELKDKLAAAIARGDVAAGTTLARELGLKYLPLAIETLPPGAEIWHDGKQIGVSPLVLDISAADRVDYQIEVREAGYLPATTTGATAEAGWRLLVKLERQDAITSRLGGLVTSRPALAGSRIVVASRSGLGTVDAAGQVEWLPFEKEGVDSPVYGAPTVLGNEILLATRDQIALSVLRLPDSQLQVQRLPLNGRSDFSPVVHRSSLIDNRRYVIIAALDGALHGSDDHNAANTWKGPSGAPFVTAPVIAGDVVLALRKDGTIERLQADDGQLLPGEKIGVPVLTAWPTSKGFSGYTATEMFVYDGDSIARTPLPQTAVDGAENLLLTVTNRVLIRSTTGDRSWDDVGRLDGQLSGAPLVWNGQAVLPLGKSLQVLGKRGFQLVAKAEFLAPIVLGERLVTITQDGDVHQFDP